MPILEKTIIEMLSHLVSNHPELVDNLQEILNSSSPRKFNITAMDQWAIRGFSSPSPHFIKQQCIIRNGIPKATWVETGTFLGETTELISKNANKVYSIEPEINLFNNALNKFKEFNNIHLINGTSEEVFPNLLPSLNGDINFWLDGHYSAGITFKGAKDTPIIDELFNIKNNLKNFNKLCILIDDIRLFKPKIPEFSDYPELDFLVDWARDLNMNWIIEQDIFIAKNY